MNRESDNGSREPDPDLLRGVDRQQTDPGASAVATSDEIRTNSHFEFPKTVHIYHHYEDSGDGKRTFEQAEKSNKSPASLPPSPVEHVVTAVRDLLKRVAVPIGRVSPGPSLSGAADSADDKDKCVDEKLSDSSPNNEDATTNGESWFDDSVPMPPPPRKLWHGMDGLAVMGLGVLAPILITGLTLLSCPKRITLLLINHPCETLLEMMMVAFIPFATYRVWRSCCNSDWRFKPTRGLLLGLGLCASLLSALVSFAALFGSCSELSLATGTDFTTGFFTIGMLALGSALSQIYVANVVRRNKDFKSSQIRVVIYVLAGLFLGAASFAASECRSWCVRIAEKSALSSRAADRSYGLFMLRELNTEKELRLETSDPRSVGLAGLFIPLKQSDVHKLYFTVTGLPFRSEADSDYSAMSDDYLARHVVGSPVKGLSLVRSAINGKVNANALSSTIGWTYVFHNDTIDSQEVRAEIALPPDAAISNLTVWQDGEPMEATFSASGKAVDSGGSMNVGHESPAIISDLGRGRYLFHCYPVREGGELKVQITAVLPLRLESLESAELNIPRFIACNFELEGEHTLHLESKGKLFSSLSNLKSTRGALGKEMLDGNLTASQIEHTPLLVTARRDSGARTVVATDRKGAEIALQDAKQEAARKRAELAELEREAGYDDKNVVVMIDGAHGVKQQLEDVETVIAKAKKLKHVVAVPKATPRWSVRQIKEVTASGPRHVVAVIDGSASVREKLPEIERALKSIPASVSVSLMVASQEDRSLSQPTPITKALPLLANFRFKGGQSNLEAVVKAAEVAGLAQGGVVLWIHGAQPALYPDIYIMSPFANKPQLFEISLDSGETDTLEYFKNHCEIASFSPLYQGNSLSNSLSEFFARWQPGCRDFVTEYSLVDARPAKVEESTADESRELILLNCKKTVERLIKERKFYRAARIAVKYQIVTPVSCTAVIESNLLDGATNGTIGPQGEDASAILGVNTAGTVRVNNIANLEALLNIIANLLEVAGLFLGALVVLHGVLVKGETFLLFGLETRLTPFTRICTGVALVMMAVITPGLINWFVASARDANLFS